MYMLLMRCSAAGDVRSLINIYLLPNKQRLRQMHMCSFWYIQYKFKKPHFIKGYFLFVFLRSYLLGEEQEIQGDVDARSSNGRHPSPRSFTWSWSLTWCNDGSQSRAITRFLSQHDGPQSGPSIFWTLPARTLWLWPGEHAPIAQGKAIEETLFHFSLYRCNYFKSPHYWHYGVLRSLSGLQGDQWEVEFTGNN